MDINYDELRKQSRIAAGLTACASVLVLGSLLWSTWETRNAQRELNAIALQKAALQKDIWTLNSQVQSIKFQKEKLERADAGQSAALNALVMDDAKATKALNEVAQSNALVAQSVPRIFIHQKDSKELALNVAQKLRSLGYIVLAPDEMEDGDGTRIVYFNGPDDPETIADVQAIKQAMKDSNPAFSSIWVQLDNRHRHPNRTYAIYVEKTITVNVTPNNGLM
jgi:hypothetical protein